MRLYNSCPFDEKVYQCKKFLLCIICMKNNTDSLETTRNYWVRYSRSTTVSMTNQVISKLQREAGQDWEYGAINLSYKLPVVGLWWKQEHIGWDISE